MKKWLLLLFLTALSAAAQTVALDPVSATHGAKFKKVGTALVIDFPAYDRKINNTHPTVNLLMPPDCTAYDGVDVDMRLSGGLSTSLSINFRDSTGKQCYDIRPVADGIRTTLRFRFNPARKMDKKAMKYLRIYLGRPALAAQFTIYGIKFFSVLEEKKQILLPVAKEFGVAKEVEKLTNLTDCEKVTAQLRKKQIAKLISGSNPDARRFPFGAAFCSPLARPLPFCGVISDKLSLSGELSLALNETENLNLLTVSTKPLKSVTASVSGSPILTLYSITIGSFFTLINPKNIDINLLDPNHKQPKDETVQLSFTALENYNECPFKYKLALILKFSGFKVVLNVALFPI